MEYRGPQQADFDNVRALNHAFLALLATPARVPRLIAALEEPNRRRLLRLTGLQRDRLASAPFLLLSVRERDAALWDGVFAGELHGDLFRDHLRADAAEAGVLHATLGFLWQLARSNPYALRLVSGASLYWCERFADVPLCQLIALTMRRELLVLRRADDGELWQKLLTGAQAGNRAVRRAARIGAWQRLLTETAARAAPARRAARALSASAHAVAERANR